MINNNSSLPKGFNPNVSVGKYSYLPITDDFAIKIKSIRKVTRHSTLRLHFQENGEPYITCQAHILASDVRNFVLKHLDYIIQNRDKIVKNNEIKASQSRIKVEYVNSIHREELIFNKETGIFTFRFPLYLEPIPQDVIDRKIEQYKTQIAKVINQWEICTNPKYYCQFNQGDQVPIWGELYTINLIDSSLDNNITCKLHHDTRIFELSIPKEKNFTIHKLALYRRTIFVELKNYVEVRFRELCKEMEAPVWALQFKPLKNAFGKCFNYKKLIQLDENLGMYSKDFVDSVIIHEIVHIEISGHPDSFYKRVLQFCPDYFEIDEQVKSEEDLYSRFMHNFP